MEPDEPPLTEDDAYPANPDNEYGWGVGGIIREMKRRWL
jgi:hypothetical protein